MCKFKVAQTPSSRAEKCNFFALQIKAIYSIEIYRFKYAGKCYVSVMEARWMLCAMRLLSPMCSVLSSLSKRFCTIKLS